jgi:peptidoglycan/LPS O-acetylase OafA/YrhL
VHFPLLLLLAPHLGGKAGWGVGIALYAAVVGSSLLAAEIGYRFVEVPSIRLGNAICRRIAARFGTQGVSSERAPAA